MILVGVYAVLILGAGGALLGWIQVRSFLKSHSSISSQSEFDEFKRVVKTNMFLALAIMVSFGLLLVLGATGFYLDVVGWTDLLLVLFVLGPICSFAGIKLMSAESQMKAISLDNESLRQDLDHVVGRWTSSALPDW